MSASTGTRKGIKVEKVYAIMDAVKTISGFLLIFGITFEISPIKINPLQWLGKRLNRDTNDRIDKIQKKVEQLEYNGDMKDLRTVKNRIHAYGMLVRRGEVLSPDAIKSVIDDLDVYDFYKETYKYMDINGRKVKINGEVEADRKLIMEQFNRIKKH